MRANLHSYFIAAAAAVIFSIPFNQSLNCQNISYRVQSEVDMTFLDDIVQNVRIIALGESSHGLGELYQVKSEIVKYLHEKHGFSVLAIESGLGDIMLASADQDIDDPRTLRDKSLFGNFQCQEIMPLFEHLIQSRKSNPLSYVGFDTQLSGGYFDSLLDQILNKYAPDQIDSLASAFDSYYKLIPSSREETPTNFLYHRNKFTRNIDHIRSMITQHQDGLSDEFGLTDFEEHIIIRTLKMLSLSIDVDWEDRFYLIVRRDELMFENLVWLADTILPKQKFIVWGHNGHIQKRTPGGNTTKFMGQRIKEKYGNQYYSMGLFVTKGNTYQHWTRDTVTFDNSDPAFLESKMQSDKGFQFLNLLNSEVIEANPWLKDNIKALEIENGGEINFVPINRFDGILNINESDVPTFN